MAMFHLSLIFISLFLHFANAQSVVNVRYGSYPDKERIVLDVGKNVDYRIILLENPKRIVVDIENMDISIRNPQNVSLRVGKHPWGTRIVIDREFASVKSFSLNDPFRIVVDIYKQGKEDRKQNQMVLVKDDDPLIAILDPKVLSIIGEGNGIVIDQKVKNAILTEKRTVVIDPGHGGRDPGAIGFMGIKEKDINLAISRRLASYLRNDGRFNVILTRDKDVFVPLHERANIALRNRADLFVSIHANASPKGISSHARGTLVFAISSEAARQKRDRIVRDNNYASLVLGRPDLPTNARVILADLAVDVTLYESINVARKISQSLSRNLPRDVEFKGTQRAGFAVLKTPGIPSVLVEVGFITNPEEAMLMVKEDFQEKFARALYEAIVDYFFPKPSKKLTLNQKPYVAEELPSQ